jgi:hypothetical protein
VTVERRPRRRRHRRPRLARRRRRRRWWSSSAGPGDHDRADRIPGRLRAVLQPRGRLRAWPYPAYPPYYPYPPGYAFGAAALSFGVGMAVGAAVWGNCNWGGGNVEINNSNYQNYSKNVNRSDVANNRATRSAGGTTRRQTGRNGSTTRRIGGRPVSRSGDAAALQPRGQRAGHPVARGLPRARRARPPGPGTWRCRVIQRCSRRGTRRVARRTRAKAERVASRSARVRGPPGGGRPGRSRGWAAVATPGASAIGDSRAARA